MWVAPSTIYSASFFAIPPLLITKQPVDIEMAATVWTKQKFWLWRCQNNLQSEGATFGEMSAINCDNVNKGGSFLQPCGIWVFSLAWMKKYEGLWCRVFVFPPDLCSQVQQGWPGKNIPNILEWSALGLRVSTSPKSNCFSRSAVHGKHGALASARVTRKWVSWRLCNSSITECVTKQTVMDQRVCVLDTFSLH